MHGHNNGNARATQCLIIKNTKESKICDALRMHARQSAITTRHSQSFVATPFLFSRRGFSHRRHAGPDWPAGHKMTNRQHLPSFASIVPQWPAQLAAVMRITTQLHYAKKRWEFYSKCSFSMPFEISHNFEKRRRRGT